jgi:hypothetical protein
VSPSRLSTGSPRARRDDTISKMQEPDRLGERSGSGTNAISTRGAQQMSIGRQNGAPKFRQPRQISARADPEINCPPGRFHQEDWRPDLLRLVRRKYPGDVNGRSS